LFLENLSYGTFLSYLKDLQLDKHILRGRRGSEENIKIKFVIPLLQTLGWQILEDMDFESLGIDIVLHFQDKPSIIVETKSWGEAITNHLDQCLEYSFKIGTPWLMISSGRETAIYCILTDIHNLRNLKPLIRFSYNELINSNGYDNLNKLGYYFRKDNFNNNLDEIINSIDRILPDIDIRRAYDEFMKQVSLYKPKNKKDRLSDAEYLIIANKHSKEIKEALITIHKEMSELVNLNKRLQIHYRSKEIGIEYYLRLFPRDKILGLFGVYPSSANIAFGLEGWRKLNISEATLTRLKKYPRKAASKEWAVSLIELLKLAIGEIKENRAD